MAKFGFSLVFLLAVSLSTHSVLGTFETAEYVLNQLKGAASGMEGAAENLQNNAVEMMDDAKDSSGSWSDWAKTKFEALGFTSGSPPLAEAPAEAPTLAYAGPPTDTFSDSTGSAGYGPAGAPQAY